MSGTTNLKFQDESRQLIHDLRSPLNLVRVILGGRELNEESRALLNLAFYRMEEILTNRVESSLHTSNLREAIADVVREKQVFQTQEISFSVDDQQAARVAIAPAQFKRVLSNLIDNACETIEGKGKVEIKMSQSQSQVSIAIRDSGPGFPAWILQRLGRRGLTFGKVREVGSGGLGLSHAKQVIEDAGGKLTARNTRSGAQVLLELPLI